METDAKPVAQKPRPVLYYLQKPLKEWLDQGVKERHYLVFNISGSPKREWRSREIHANSTQDQTNCQSARQKPSWQEKCSSRHAYPLQINLAPSYRSCPVQSPPPCENKVRLHWTWTTEKWEGRHHRPQSCCRFINEHEFINSLKDSSEPSQMSFMLIIQSDLLSWLQIYFLLFLLKCEVT